MNEFFRIVHLVSATPSLARALKAGQPTFSLNREAPREP
jgi:hypothetical protein